MKKQKSNSVSNSIVLVLVFLCFSCASKQSSLSNTSPVESTPKLIFLNYSITKTKAGNKSISFINKIITNGRLKAYSNKYPEKGIVGDLKCTQLNTDSIEISHVYVKNPLSKTIEYINDSLEFENKHLDLDKAALSLKLQLDNTTKFITISEIIDTLQQSKPLITTTLN